MLLTPHTIVGVAIGATVQDPVAAGAISLSMHFLGDLVPHWDFFSHTTHEQRRTGWRPIAVMFDMAVGICIGLSAVLYALWVLNSPIIAVSIFVAGIASVLPDAIEAPLIYCGKDIAPAVTNVQRRLQFQAPLPWGLLTQAVVIVLSAFVILNSLKL